MRLLAQSEAGAPETALKLASAFGESNAALVVGKRRGQRRLLRPAFVGPGVLVPGLLDAEAVAALVAAAGVKGVNAERLARGDGLVRLAVAAVASLAASAAPGVRLDGAGIVVGSALSTLETNAVFAQRIRERGARLAEPRRFPYTSPNASAGECSILFGLTGPGFAVGGGLHAGLEALAAAAWLVEGGDADRVVVVAVDEAGPAAAGLGFVGDGGLGTGAVAALVSAHPEGAIGRIGAIHLARGGGGGGAGGGRAGASGTAFGHYGHYGHKALRPLVRGGGPATTLESGSPPDAFARIVLDPV